MLASVVHCFRGSPITDPRVAIVWLLLIAGVGFLMVSNWRFWSGKEIDSSGRKPFQFFVWMALLIAVIWRFSEIALIVIALGLPGLGRDCTAGVLLGSQTPDGRGEDLVGRQEQAMTEGMYRIAIVGASSLAGKELADELGDSCLQRRTSRCWTTKK